MNFFVGLWPIVSKFGIAFGLIAALLAFAWFSPIFKKAALAVAAIITATTIAYYVGVSDGEKRVRARWEAALEQELKNGEQLREDAERSVDRDTPDGVRNDACNRDNWRPGQQAC